MRHFLMLSILALTMPIGLASAQTAGTGKHRHLNPVIDLLEQKQPAMGLYRPGHPAHGSANESKPKEVLHEFATQTVSYKSADFFFDGSMEYGFHKGFPGFAAFAKALKEVAPFSHTLPAYPTHPMIVKMEKLAPEVGTAEAMISKQLNHGVVGIMFVDVESAAEAERGIAAMRFKSKGGTRPDDDIGDAPAFWGLTEDEYREKADVWPINPNGELINWTIIETIEGLENVREIAAVKGIGVLWPGAGSLRQVFSTTGPDGKRVVDEDKWEAAIQKVLAACKEFSVACGYPASPANIEMRMKQGFNVFVMGWGDAGFEAVEIGRKAAGRPPINP